MYQTIFFDLDGTLTDSAPGIINSIKYALKKYGIEAEEERLRAFLGPPLIASFQKQFGFDHDKAVEAVKFYREYFTAGGMFENAVYPGVRELLAGLHAAGKTIGVATSKPELFAKQILAHFGLDKEFDVICGAAMDESRTHKNEVLDYALKTLSADPADMVMVGDRRDDMEAAKQLGLMGIGVLYGYGSEEELTKANATFLAKTPADVYRIIAG